MSMYIKEAGDPLMLQTDEIEGYNTLLLQHRQHVLVDSIIEDEN